MLCFGKPDVLSPRRTPPVLGSSTRQPICGRQGACALALRAQRPARQPKVVLVLLNDLDARQTPAELVSRFGDDQGGCTPAGYAGDLIALSQLAVWKYRALQGSAAAAVVAGEDAEEAAADADCIVADTWVSMGDSEAERRHNLLKPYQVNARLMARAKKHAIFMHCLPAHRGEEVTAGVIDGPQSAVWRQAENRMHTARAALAWMVR